MLNSCKPCVFNTSNSVYNLFIFDRNGLNWRNLRSLFWVDNSFFGVAFCCIEINFYSIIESRKSESIV